MYVLRQKYIYTIYMLYLKLVLVNLATKQVLQRKRWAERGKTSVIRQN